MTLTRLQTALLWAIALMISACSVAQQPGAPNFLSEVRAARAENPKAPFLGLIPIAKKYFPVGMPKDLALKYLTDLGFVVQRDVNQNPPKPDSYMARKREGAPAVYPSYFHDEYRVSLDFADGKVSEAWARLFSHSQ
jgi:hypothetical protein